jgi:hypothetical protein
MAHRLHFGSRSARASRRRFQEEPMVQLSARHAVVGAVARDHESGAAREWLYKDDHPRDIDRVIDFFGDGLPRAEDADGCGEVFLESLA